ncbi:hypothetical protein ASG59_17555 [Methylobacterium sp. Leaf466]|nr:hypothetical protein ASG59_17555 [Methylobacterium sp. Leaf466]
MSFQALKRTQRPSQLFSAVRVRIVSLHSGAGSFLITQVLHDLVQQRRDRLSIILEKQGGLQQGQDAIP